MSRAGDDGWTTAVVSVMLDYGGAKHEDDVYIHLLYGRSLQPPDRDCGGRYMVYAW
jgi:hypothetical protein